MHFNEDLAFFQELVIDDDDFLFVLGIGRFFRRLAAFFFIVRVNPFYEHPGGLNLGDAPGHQLFNVVFLDGGVCRDEHIIAVHVDGPVVHHPGP